MAEYTLDPKSLAADLHLHRPVRVTLPRKVAYDLDKFVEIQREIFDRLGHAACYSGFDIRWDMEDRFRFDLEANEVVAW